MVARIVNPLEHYGPSPSHTYTHTWTNVACRAIATAAALFWRHAPRTWIREQHCVQHRMSGGRSARTVLFNLGKRCPTREPTRCPDSRRTCGRNAKGNVTSFFPSAVPQTLSRCFSSDLNFTLRSDRAPSYLVTFANFQAGAHFLYEI